MMYALFPLAAALAVHAIPRAQAPAPAVRSVAVVPVEGRAQVVVGVDRSVQIQDFTLDNPARIVIDLKGATLAGPVSVYDRVARGAITDVRVSQYRQNTVRVVVELDHSQKYELKRDTDDLRIAVAGNATTFTAWRSTATPASKTQAATADEAGEDTDTATPEIPDPASASFSGTSGRSNAITATQASQQPRITVNYQDADIHDVIAAFAAFAGRTIVAGKDVKGTVTAEIRNQPWDVALRAILQGQGLAASEDLASGIISVDSYANIQAKQALEPLVTQLVPINYAKADSLAPVVAKLLVKDCSNGAGASAAPAAGATGATGGTAPGCVTRGAVAANPATNTLIVTEAPSRIGDILNYVKKLDIRTHQVAIKAKIIFVNRTDIENLGLSYDLGTRNQFFSQLVTRVDSVGSPIQGDRILLGGHLLAAIANANNRVASPALSLVYSATVGRYSLTAFLDALREARLADLQAEPSIVTVDNQEAQIQVGQDIPVRVLDASATTTGGTGSTAPRATVSFRSVGIILKVTPHITNNRQILLDVHAENSSAEIASSDIGFIFNKQSADNRLLVLDGQTAVIGGLTVTQISQSRSGIPGLSDIPMVGKLFSTSNKSEEKRDLLILITPHVVDEGERVQPRS
jgi:type IV pilus assembly protein PilQ